jgi:hypothetical protein
VISVNLDESTSAIDATRADSRYFMERKLVRCEGVSQYKLSLRSPSRRRTLRNATHQKRASRRERAPLARLRGAYVAELALASARENAAITEIEQGLLLDAIQRITVAT